MIQLCMNCLSNSLSCNSTLIFEFNEKTDRDNLFNYIKSNSDYNLRKDYVIRGFFKNSIVYLLEVRIR